MRIRTRLILGFVGCGVLPLVVVVLVTYWSACQGMSEIQAEAEQDVRDKAINQLVSLRDVKKQQIESYFEQRQRDISVLTETVATLREEAAEKLVAVRQNKRLAVEKYFQGVRDQVLTFSEDQMVIDAMGGFKFALSQVRNENSTTPEAIENMKRELSSYYVNDFTNQYKQLNAGKAPAVDAFFGQLDDDSVVLQYNYIRINPHPVGSKQQLDRANDSSAYSRLHGNVHPKIRKYQDRFGYDDIFLVDSRTGKVVYSVSKELDYGTSLVDGPYADSNFGEAFRRVNSTADNNEVVFVDYSTYAPIYGDPASFVASPIFDGSEKIGVVVFRVSADPLNTIMGVRDGLGESGETYLVGQDFQMRSDSHADPENHSVVASLKNPGQGKVETDAVKRALAGESGTDILVDYADNLVISAYSPLKFGDVNWAVLVEIDVAEAFCPKIEGSDHEFFSQYNEQYGYYDLYLLNPDGYCFYAVGGSSDYRTNLTTGDYKDSNFGRLVRQVLTTKEFGFVDFEPYEPSDGDPRAFIAQPILGSNGEVQVVVALQLPMDHVNEIMSVRAGMGETGETYLVGPDKRMRSDSVQDPQARTVQASFAGTIENNGVDTDASTAALAGETAADVIADYSGNSVLSAFTPVEVFGDHWALIAEIDEAEAFDAVGRIQAIADTSSAKLARSAMGLCVVVGLIVMVAGVTTARKITVPLHHAVDSIKEVAKTKDLTKRLPHETKDEVGELADGFNELVIAFQSGISDITTSAAKVAGSSTELTTAATQLSTGAQEMTGQSSTVASAGEEMSISMNDMSDSAEQMTRSVKSISSAVSEMTCSISEIAKNADQAASVAGNAAQLAEISNSTIGQLGDAANEIGKVIETIQDIAEQTNLLALNATIEAARAGDAGKGFAVVAEEVKQLARQTADATEDIRQRIEGIQDSTGNAVDSIAQISEVIRQVNDVSNTIASAVEEQSITTKEIALNLSQTSDAAESFSSGVAQSKTASVDIAKGVTQMATSIKQTASGASVTQDAGEHLTDVATRLNELVSQFHV